MMTTCRQCQTGMNPDQGMFCVQCVARRERKSRKDLIESDEYKDASEVTKYEFALSLHMRRILNL